MVEIELDGSKVSVPEGSLVMHAAEQAGTYIPHFCYHKKLSVAANCRMCLVDIEKAPKPMPACATPVTQGMVVRTKSEKALKAQQSVMEFLLINHPLDCPICDQGGECQLQDLAVGYGGSGSRYAEEKRVVANKDIGPLISMEEMSRCIHCTRCVRFGQEVAGIMELGMSHRGEHAEIETFVGQSVDSELSGNMIDICPVGALTSKPFRYSARTWELSRRKSISPHDSTGANLIVQVKNNTVMRVVPLENEAVNECWIADRDRFSYESLNSDERLNQPMIKQGSEWRVVDWTTALEYVANGIKQISATHGANSVAALVSPHCTVEELHLATQLIRSLGSDSIDHRARAAQLNSPSGVRWLGTSIASLSGLQRALVLGSNLRKDHPLFAQRVRQSVRKGAQVHAIHHSIDDWAMPLASQQALESSHWVQHLAEICSAVAEATSSSSPVAVSVTTKAKFISDSLLKGERKAILLGNDAAHHQNAEELLALANWLGEKIGASVGFLTEAANTVGAQLVGAQPQTSGHNAQDILGGKARVVMLLNNEPRVDSIHGASGLNAAEMVVSLSPFKANMDIADVILPISPFTETSGTFVNAEGLAQHFHAVVKPLGETRPAWKVFRVLGNVLGLPGFTQESTQDVLKAVDLGAERLSNQSSIAIENIAMNRLNSLAYPQKIVTIYQLDGMVRRSPSLQLTADARGEVVA